MDNLVKLMKAVLILSFAALACVLAMRAFDQEAFYSGRYEIVEKNLVVWKDREVTTKLLLLDTATGDTWFYKAADQLITPSGELRFPVWLPVETEQRDLLTKFPGEG